jgi:LPS-assembly protein
MTGSIEGRALAALAAGVALVLPTLACGSTALAQDEAAPAPQTGPGDPVSTSATVTSEEDLVYIEADEIFADPETGRYIARGAVEVRYGDRTLRADEVVVYPETNRVLASGNIIIEDDEGVVTFADEAEFSEDLTQGVIEGMSALLPNDGKTGAAYAVRREGGVNELHRAFYTVCDACTAEGETKRPSWRLRARRVVQDEAAQMLYYRDAVLEVKGVPVLYAPFFAHADPSSDRRSGLLLPHFGESTRTGTFYEQPYYWSISESQDATISPRFMTNANPLLVLEHRKLFFSGGSIVQGSVTREFEFDNTGTKFGERKWRGHIFANAEFDLSEQWSWGLGVERVSDDLYFARYEIDDTDQQRGLYHRGSKRLLSQLFVEGHGDDFHATLAGLMFQGLRQGDDEDELPIVLPLGEYRRQLARNLLGGRLDGRLSTAVLERTEGQDSRRASGELDWRRQFIAPVGIIAEPFAYARGDVYSISDFTTVDGEDVDDVIARGLGYVGAEVSWPFGRTAGAFDLIIEPIGSVIIAPTGGNDPRIPNNDSLVTELDESNIFDPNRSPGYDIWEDGSHAVVGGRAIARWSAESEATFFLGQSFRADDALEFAAATGLAGDASDIVGAAELAFDPRRRFAARFRIDEEDFDFQRLDLDATYEIGRASLSSKYLRFADELAVNRPREELSYTAGVEFTRNIGAFYSATQDLDLDETRYATVGLVYDDECTRLEIIYKRDGTRDRALNEGESIRLQVTLTSLGTFGGD